MLSDDLKAGLSVAFNEATLLGFEFDPRRALAGATMSVLSLPAGNGPMPEEPRIQLLFKDVSRLILSLRLGRWDDQAAPVQPVPLEDVLAVVQSFGGLPVYGWEFFDRGERDLAEWGDRLSLDWKSEGGSHAPHSLFLFQEGPDRHLDMSVWFRDMEARRPSGETIPLQEVADAGKRWWDAFHAHDPRTKGLGMEPLA